MSKRKIDSDNETPCFLTNKIFKTNSYSIIVPHGENEALFENLNSDILKVNQINEDILDKSISGKIINNIRQKEIQDRSNVLISNDQIQNNTNNNTNLCLKHDDNNRLESECLFDVESLPSNSSILFEQKLLNTCHQNPCVQNSNLLCININTKIQQNTFDLRNIIIDNSKPSIINAVNVDLSLISHIDKPNCLQYQDKSDNLFSIKGNSTSFLELSNEQNFDDFKHSNQNNFNTSLPKQSLSIHDNNHSLNDYTILKNSISDNNLICNQPSQSNLIFNNQINICEEVICDKGVYKGINMPIGDILENETHETELDVVDGIENSSGIASVEGSLLSDLLDSPNENEISEDTRSFVSTNKEKKCLSFGKVEVFYFARRQGFICIPSQGGSTLGMADNHCFTDEFSIDEFEKHQHKIHKQILLEHQKLASQQLKQNENQHGVLQPIQNQIEIEMVVGDNDLNIYNYYFLQPLVGKQRRALLRESGVTKINAEEKLECRAIRASREKCGCSCIGGCFPDTCQCSLNGIKCQVDRSSFPCMCTQKSCQNMNGRIEFNPMRVKFHLMRTLFYLNNPQQNHIMHNSFDPNSLNQSINPEINKCNNDEASVSTHSYLNNYCTFEMNLNDYYNIQNGDTNLENYNVSDEDANDEDEDNEEDDEYYEDCYENTSSVSSDELQGENERMGDFLDYRTNLHDGENNDDWIEKDINYSIDKHNQDENIIDNIEIQQKLNSNNYSDQIYTNFYINNDLLIKLPENNQCSKFKQFNNDIYYNDKENITNYIKDVNYEYKVFSNITKDIEIDRDELNLNEDEDSKNLLNEGNVTEEYCDGTENFVINDDNNYNDIICENGLNLR